MQNLHDKPSILQKIIADKIQWVESASATLPLAQFEKNITKSDRSFYQALERGTHANPAFILECKKASPSKGLIRSDFNPARIAEVYRDYAAAVSVLTDEKYFQGDFRYLRQVREQISQPVLCKDFMISDYQVYLARYHQADAILLMLSVLDDESYLHLAALAHELGMGVLTETSNQAELERALNLGAKVIGINNRDLHDLSVDLNRTPPLAAQIPPDRIIISESGIYRHEQIVQLKPYVNGFLIGSSLMGSEDLNNAIRALIYGENKVCGLTRAQDVEAAYAAGALYAGLIFAEHSPRSLSLRQAQELVTRAPLRFVGVFQNQAAEFIVKIALQLNLYAVQLHGTESPEFIRTLRTKLAPEIQIWKAISIDIDAQSAVENIEDFCADRYIFDSKVGNRRGGSGQSFDWSKIPSELKPHIMLAGGINADNIESALAQGCLGLDLNSGAESCPGVKDKDKLSFLFNKILAFY
ncbi:indole-3-glycerol phosphate synthase [Mesocricetibacter intestinalis]|uniref:Multifunctional fusion protein n=1 Tax=Mesocricetibacter intestinalis TaxID=1521930 RepID=A0A4R6VBR9_9PAST|nr:bifunctional indole-3-glycerol-phosphate synthase TrpC/phosphoribosylanthranilate isomerase TrpF [Mesocricetibacter intestinalis]TDQ59083.1 indole-3-glycerol phosphate synthase [Mesocricetibacter intestinalis]